MSERDILIDCLRYRPVATTAAQMREAADLLERDGVEIARLRAYIQEMVEKAAAKSLDGYRELGARAAAAENELDAARAALAEAQEELRVCQQDAIRLQSALAEPRAKPAAACRNRITRRGARCRMDLHHGAPPAPSWRSSRRRG